MWYNDNEKPRNGRPRTVCFFFLFLKATVRHLNLFLKVDESTRAILAII